MTVAVSHLAAWAPGIGSYNDWEKWATGALHIERTNASPKLEYTDMLFRRRLSQISKMTVQVVHDVLEKAPHAQALKQVFISLRGELVREFAVSKMLVTEHALLPAHFSLSVFNTPIALATIALGLRAGYTAIYPAQGNFCAAFHGACAPLFSGSERELMLVYADELAPAEYGALGAAAYEPLAFAAILSNGTSCGTACGTSCCDAENLRERCICIESEHVPDSAAAFLKLLITKG